MTSKNMTPRKVVAMAPAEDDIYVVADDGTMWSAVSNGTAWKQMPPLPPREDEGEMAPTEDERLRIQRLVDVCNRLRSDLRRVREALRKCTDMGGYVLADFAELMTIDAEKMP